MKNYKSRIKHKLENIYLFNSSASLYLFLKILYKKIVNFDLDQRAAAVSFSLMLAVFPGTLFLFTLIPFIPIDHLDVQIMAFLKNILPSQFYFAISETILEIVSRPRGDILSFGFILTIYAATSGMNSLMTAFNIALREGERRSFLKSRLIAFLLTILLVMILIVALGFLIVGKLIINYFSTHGFIWSDFNQIIYNIVSYTSVFSIFFLGLCCIYYFAPAIHKKLNFFNFGAVIASILCILATNLFSFYLENFNSYNRLYGSIGTLIAIMVWIYLIALIIILGFEVNISFRHAVSHGER